MLIDLVWLESMRAALWYSGSHWWFTAQRFGIRPSFVRSKHVVPVPAWVGVSLYFCPQPNTVDMMVNKVNVSVYWCAALVVIEWLHVEGEFHPHSMSPQLLQPYDSTAIDGLEAQRFIRNVCCLIVSDGADFPFPIWSHCCRSRWCLNWWFLFDTISSENEKLPGWMSFSLTEKQFGPTRLWAVRPGIISETWSHLVGVSATVILIMEYFRGSGLCGQLHRPERSMRCIHNSLGLISPSIRICPLMVFRKLALKHPTWSFEVINLRNGKSALKNANCDGVWAWTEDTHKHQPQSLEK